MQARIRILKRGVGANRNSLPANRSEETARQLDREMANAVKSWIAECEARNRELKTAAASLLRSLENSTPSPTPQFGFNQ
jgi:hypothetical protein